MSSDSEEENGVQRDAEDSDGGRYSHRSRSRSRSSGRALPWEDDIEKDHQGQDRKENGMRGGGSDEYDAKKYDGQRDANSKSPDNKETMDCSASSAVAEESKRRSRSRSKSKPRDTDVVKEQKSGGSSSSAKKKTRSRRSRSRSRSKRRSRSRRHSRSRSRSYSSRSRRRSRSRSRRRTRSRSRRRTRSRSRSRSGTPVDGARLHVAELDVDTRKRDLERVFEKYGRLREIWMARNPPCFAFVVYAHQKDADRALKETDGIMIGHCRIKVTQARPRVRGGRMRSGYDPNLRCYQCGELGHFSRNCTDTKFGYKRPPTPPGNVIWRGPQL